MIRIQPEISMCARLLLVFMKLLKTFRGTLDLCARIAYPRGLMYDPNMFVVLFSLL